MIGRYGSTNARAKIPLGFYYGHTYILPWESELKLMHDPLRGETDAASQPDVDQHLAMMVALQEDIQCRSEVTGPPPPPFRIRDEEIPMNQYQ